MGDAIVGEVEVVSVSGVLRGDGVDPLDPGVEAERETSVPDSQFSGVDTARYLSVTEPQLLRLQKNFSWRRLRRERERERERERLIL